MSSSILKEQMVYELIVGHRLPWDCISSRRFIALWVRPLGQRLGGKHKEEEEEEQQQQQQQQEQEGEE
ncbi:unnamed protein product [Schistosoma margrebowiei]|uniref:Uncharacterized protein n=1 Tax=Schistosoma margrebowiei TaxID=48269 RepID=A0A183M5K0_9TREM|nr:unnamed protein product [Schistosoma margrebowiei]